MKYILLKDMTHGVIDIIHVQEMLLMVFFQSFSKIQVLYIQFINFYNKSNSGPYKGDTILVKNIPFRRKAEKIL